MGQNRPRRLSDWAALSALARLRLGGLLAILALAIQAFVIEPHFDAQGLRPAIEAAQGSAIATADPAQKSAPVCLICQAAALSRTATLSGAPRLQLVEHTLFVASAPPRLPVRELKPTRPWQSRAPPLFA